MHPTEEDFWGYFHNELTEAQRESLGQHLKECGHCSEKLMILEQQERFFQNIDFPLPSEDFASKITEKVLLKKAKADKFWIRVFKIAISLSFLLMIVAIAWNAKPLDFDFSDYYRAFIWYGIPVALLVLIMRYLDNKKISF